MIAQAGSYEQEAKMCEVEFGELPATRVATPLLRDERLELTARELERIQRARFNL